MLAQASPKEPSIEEAKDDDSQMTLPILPSLSERERQGETGKGVGKEEESEKVNEGKAKEKKEAIIIEDVHSFKAGMTLSKAARPVKDLSTFEQIE